VHVASSTGSWEERMRQNVAATIEVVVVAVIFPANRASTHVNHSLHSGNDNAKDTSKPVLYKKIKTGVHRTLIIRQVFQKIN